MQVSEANRQTYKQTNKYNLQWKWKCTDHIHKYVQIIFFATCSGNGNVILNAGVRGSSGNLTRVQGEAVQGVQHSVPNLGGIDIKWILEQKLKMLGFVRAWSTPTTACWRLLASPIRLLRGSGQSPRSKDFIQRHDDGRMKWL